MMMTRETAELAGNHVGVRAQISGVLIQVWAFATSSQFLSLAGIVLTAIGIFVSLHFKIQRNRREQAEHEARMMLLRQSVIPPALDDAQYSDSE